MRQKSRQWVPQDQSARYISMRANNTLAKYIFKIISKVRNIQKKKISRSYFFQCMAQISLVNAVLSHWHTVLQERLTHSSSERVQQDQRRSVQSRANAIHEADWRGGVIMNSRSIKLKMTIFEIALAKLVTICLVEACTSCCTAVKEGYLRKRLWVHTIWLIRGKHPQ